MRLLAQGSASELIQDSWRICVCEHTRLHPEDPIKRVLGSTSSSTGKSAHTGRGGHPGTRQCSGDGTGDCPNSSTLCDLA